jgi:YVTN family beta-propeller protein
VLAKIVEKASGKSFTQFIGENILKPLKMTQSVVYNEKKPKVPNRAVSYQKTDDAYADVDYTPLNLIYGDGSINSTIEDLAKWDAALYTEKLVKSETLKQAFTPAKLNDGKATNYGFGWFVKETAHGLETSHSGGWAGFRNFIVRYPEKRLSVVVLSNSAEFNPVENGMKIAKIFLGEDKPPAANAAVELQNSNGEVVLVVSKNERTLSFIDPIALKEIAKISVPGGPHELAVSADGRFAYVADYHQSDGTPGHSISVIDIAARKEIKKIELGGMLMPHGIFRAGNKFYFTSEMTRTVGRYNSETDSLDWIRGTGQSLTHIPAVSPDGARLYATNMFSDSVTVIEIEGSGQETTTIKQIAVGSKPEGIAVSPDGKEIWVGHNGDGGVSIIDAASLTVKQTVKVGQVPLRLIFTRDGKRVIIADPKASEMLVYDAASRQEIKRFKVAGAPVSFALSPDEKRAFVSLVGAAKAALLDLETGSVVGSVPVGIAPDGIVWLAGQR